MEEKKFEDMMDDWAARELASAPKLQPTTEMLAAVKAKKQPLFSPLFARWATVGVAAAAMLIATMMYPRWFLSPQSQREEMPISSVEQPVIAAPEAQNEKAVIPVVEDKAEEKKVVAMAAAESAADKGLAQPEIAPPAPAPEPETKPMAAERREISGDLEETSEKKADATLLEGRTKDEAVSESVAIQDADASTPTLQVFIAPTKEQAAKPKICAVQPVGSSVPQESNPLLAGKTMADAPKSSFEQQASELMSEAQRGVVTQCQQIGDKTFMLEHEVWVDSQHTPEKTMIAIQRDSEAYRQALELRPELQPYFDAWDRVIVNLGEVSLEISPQGKTTLSEENVAQLKQQ